MSLLPIFLSIPACVVGMPVFLVKARFNLVIPKNSFHENLTDRPGMPVLLYLFLVVFLRVEVFLVVETDFFDVDFFLVVDDFTASSCSLSMDEVSRNDILKGFKDFVAKLQNIFIKQEVFSGFSSLS